jgi:serine/threonine-protein kinase
MGEAEGLLFLSMEYVDGEDLASLLRRIGHLPQDKALEIARRLCAGLAAAHDKGVIHRDLKPANIMLDGQGQVRVMDFGLAAFAAQASDVRSGTPAYMAPEQKAGREVTARSDIYSLGVLVHEIYTGKRPSEKGSSKTELDPAVASVVERCLSDDPQQRPASPIAVLTALPGGDPLAVALAAGETPSPEMVANAGPTEGMSVRWAVACLGLLLGAIAGFYVTQSKQAAVERIPNLESPEMLAGRARDYIRSFGYNEPPKDTASGWEYNQALLNRFRKDTSAADRPRDLGTLQPPAITFWYRQHPWGLYSFGKPEVTRNDPWLYPGSLEVVLDPQGRLVEFHAATPERKPYAPGPAPDWNSSFAAAGLDMAKFKPAQPQFAPRSAYDVRQAWSGVYSASPATEVHVEAAAYEGKISSFRVVTPSYWADRPSRSRAENSNGFIALFVVILPLWAVVMAWRNARRGRADWKGALRLGFFGFAAWALRGLLVSHHLAAVEGAVLWKVLRDASLILFIFGVFYLAFEPYVRRRMPQSLISWNRLLEGRWRDARVGSDILIGLAAYAAIAALNLAGALGPPPVQPDLAVSASAWSAAIVESFSWSIGGALSFLLLLAVLRVPLRRTWLAAAVVVAAMALLLGGAPTGAPFWATALSCAVLLFVLSRFGLVAATTWLIANRLLMGMPLTTDFSRWYAWQGVGTALVLLARGGFAFRTNLGGRPLWKEED